MPDNNHLASWMTSSIFDSLPHPPSEIIRLHPIPLIRLDEILVFSDEVLLYRSSSSPPGTAEPRHFRLIGVAVTANTQGSHTDGGFLPAT